VSTISTPISHGIRIGTTGIYTYPSPLTITSTGYVSNDGTLDAIYSSLTGPTLDNQGTVVATGSSTIGVDFTAGGNVNNSGLISSAGSRAILIWGIAGTVTNSGTIAGSLGGVDVQGGGALVTNDAGGLIQGDGVSIGGPGLLGDNTVVNFGTIASAGGEAVYVTGTASVVRNGAGALIAGYNGVDIVHGSGSAVNSGIVSGSFWGITLGKGSITNNAGAVIQGDTLGGVYSYSGATVTNSGTIVGPGARGVGIFLPEGGSVTNTTGAVIRGVKAGISDGVYSQIDTTLTNFGTIVATGTAGVGIGLTAGGSVIDAGTITGSSGIAVRFGGTVSSLLALEHGYSLDGSVVGSSSAPNTLQLRGAAGDVTVDYNSLQLSNFGTVAFGAAAGYHETLRITNPSALPGVVAGFADTLDTIDLTTLGDGTIEKFDIATDRLTIAGTVGGASTTVTLQLAASPRGIGFAATPDGSGGTLVTETAGQPAPRDFNNDGRQDILWRNDNGAVAIWEMNGVSTLASGLPGAPSASVWHIGGTGDVNGDGLTDILWQGTGGGVAVWEMDGTQRLASATLPGSPGPSWQIDATGDMNGDGRADILWRNTGTGAVAVWQMNGLNPPAARVVGSAPSSWHIRGLGDVNGDGMADILWQNDNGAVAVWEMNGTLRLASTTLGTAPSSWHIRGMGDVNGDGKSDIIWQNDSGAVAVWELNGLNKPTSATIASVPAGWSLRGIGDYNGDGRSDILWQNTGGALAMWELNGLNKPVSGMAGAASSAWQIVPPDNTGDLATASAPASASAGDRLLAASADPSPLFAAPLLHSPFG
jgi:FG-GAP-like repeat